jgi:hypothetical protein
MELMWELPQDGLGAVENSTYQAEAAYLPVNAGSGILYLFVPNNGICAYEIVDTSVSGIEDITVNESTMTIASNVVKFGSIAEDVKVFNLTGAVVASESNVSLVELNLSAGVYVVRAVIDGKTIAQKIIIR